MEDEVVKIIQVLDDFYAGKLKDRNQLIREWISFLDSLIEVCKTADEEQKAHYRKILSTLANKLAQGMLVLTQELGIPERDLNSMVENPDNFDSNAWNKLKELKAQLDQRMKVILPLLMEEEENAPPPKKALPKKKKPVSGERRRKRRSGWISS